jgi:hypothetical protein
VQPILPVRSNHWIDQHQFAGTRLLQPINVPVEHSSVKRPIPPGRHHNTRFERTRHHRGRHGHLPAHYRRSRAVNRTGFGRDSDVAWVSIPEREGSRAEGRDRQHDCKHCSLCGMSLAENDNASRHDGTVDWYPALLRVKHPITAPPQRNVQSEVCGTRRPGTENEAPDRGQNMNASQDHSSHPKSMPKPAKDHPYIKRSAAGTLS